MARVTVSPDGCWLFTGTRNEKGYGRFPFRGKQWQAHRVSWVLNRGEIPDGLVVCHRCDNPPCVNPDHLFLGTQQVNIDDMHAKGRANHRARLGRSHSAEARARLSVAMRERWASLTPSERAEIGRRWSAARTGKSRGRYKPCPPRTCMHCGDAFEVQYPSSKQTYCSRRCSRRARL